MIIQTAWKELASDSDYPGRPWCRCRNRPSGPGRRPFWTWVPSVSAEASQARPSSSVCSVFGSECPAGHGFIFGTIKRRKADRTAQLMIEFVDGEVLAYLWDVVDDVLVFVIGADEASLLQATEVPLDFPLLLLQRQLAVLQDCRAALQSLRSLSVLNGPPLRHLYVLGLLQCTQQSFKEHKFYSTCYQKWVRHE